MWVCRLPVHIGPAECTVFTGIYGEFVTSQWADRVVGPYRDSARLRNTPRPHSIPAAEAVFARFCSEIRLNSGEKRAIL